MANIIQGTTIPLLEQALAFSESRHSLLAGNIANLDTPGYEARDLSPADFHARMKEAIEASRQAPSIYSAGTSDSAAIENAANGTPSAPISDPSKLAVEIQVNEMVKNHAQYSRAISLLTQQFRLLKAAISEQA